MILLRASTQILLDQPTRIILLQAPKVSMAVTSVGEVHIQIHLDLTILAEVQARDTAPPEVPVALAAQLAPTL